jgi:hypothetical protein
METVQNLTSKIDSLKSNYRYLFGLYRRSQFETSVDRNKFHFQRPDLEATQDKTAPTIKPAADDLYSLACSMEEDFIANKEQPDLAAQETLAEFILRSKVLSYEIDDYFLIVPSAKSERLIQKAEEISQDLPGYFMGHYGFVDSRDKQRRIKEYLLLTALCGINELYRRHHVNDYRKGIEQGKRVLSFINKEFMPPRSGLGIRGLCHYILGRLSLALGNYQDATSHFRHSVEDYSERVRVKTKRFKQREDGLAMDERNSPSFLQDKEEFEASRSATLRRCALAASFGNAYLSLIFGKVGEAVNLSALSRSILRQNCGEVYMAYADLIYWSSKRAEGSDDSDNLKNVIIGLLRCRRTFRLYVPDAHYIHQAGIQLGIAYHYLAKLRPEKQAVYYHRAVAFLESALAFAKEEVDGRWRNQRMLAEARVILSHLLCHLEADKLELALEMATEALEVSKGLAQYTCESFLAQGAVYSVMAYKISEQEERAKKINAARECIIKALKHNGGTNARIKAACYLRLADLSFLQGDPSEARYFYEKWLVVKGSVEHDFLNKWGEKIHEKLLITNDHLYVDADISFNTNYWKVKVEEYLMYAAIRELAKDLQQKKDKMREEPELFKSLYLKKGKIGPLIRNFLMAKFNIEKSDAYDKIQEYHLIDKLRSYLC